MMVLASKKESQRQVHRWRKIPPEHYLVTAVQEKKNLQNFFCLWYGLRGIENSHLQSDFPHHFTDEQQSGQFLKIKEIEFQLPVSTICLSQINTFHGNSVNLCTEQLQFPLLYSTFPL